VSGQNITFFDLLDHLPDLLAGIEKPLQLLPGNGSIVLVTPDYNNLQTELFGKYWFQFKPRKLNHYYFRIHFTKSDVKKQSIPCLLP